MVLVSNKEREELIQHQLIQNAINIKFSNNLTICSFAFSKLSRLKLVIINTNLFNNAHINMVCKYMKK